MGRLIALVVALALWPATATATAPLLQNGNFGQAASGIPTGWRVEAWARDNSDVDWEPIADGGGGVVRIINRTANDTRLCQTIPVVSGASYRVSARVRTQDVGATTAGALIAIEPRIADSVDLKGTQDWQILQVSAENVEATTWDVCLRLGSYANLNTGSAWFTDVRIDQIGGPTAENRSWFPRLAIPSVASWRQTPWLPTAAPFLGGFLLAYGLGIFRRRPR